MKCLMISCALFLAVARAKSPEVNEMEYTAQVESFCEEYNIPVDELDHPCSILTASGDRMLVSDAEIEMMERVVAAEARGETVDAQEGVATVILNRWQDGSFGDTLTEVMTASGQFAAPYDGEISISTHLAVKNALIYYNTYCMNLPAQVLYFRDSHYHTDIGAPYCSIDNLYFSTRKNVLL